MQRYGRVARTALVDCRVAARHHPDRPLSRRVDEASRRRDAGAQVDRLHRPRAEHFADRLAPDAPPAAAPHGHAQLGTRGGQGQSRSILHADAGHAADWLDVHLGGQISAVVVLESRPSRSFPSNPAILTSGQRKPGISGWAICSRRWRCPHIAAALRHHFILKDRVLRRMLP